jgi:tetratricopeptide (TPR) repeat protein
MFSFKTFFLVVLSCSSALPIAAAPLVVIVLMVKNEEQVIEQTLQPYVEAGLQSFLIFDTGSTDATVARTQNYFEQHNIKSGYIEQEPFIDFATSRNRALELAEQKFPDAAFILMPDAEWYMHNVQKLIEFCRAEQNKTESSYLVRIGDTAFEFYTPRLIRCASHVRFVGAIHEVLNRVTSQKVPTEVYFELRASSAGKGKSAQRWRRDVKILQKRYAENPSDARNLFYLAQTYGCLGDWENACIYYRERTKLNGWAEENYVAFYKLACALEQAFDMTEANHWMTALHYYLQAYTLRPQRAEPLVKIAQHYLEANNVDLAFCFAVQACRIPYPMDDILFVEKELYDYTRHDILGRCAWYVGEYEMGEEAVRTALKARPDMPHLQKNLAYYVDRRERLQKERI